MSLPAYAACPEWRQFPMPARVIQIQSHRAVVLPVVHFRHRIQDVIHALGNGKMAMTHPSVNKEPNHNPQNTIWIHLARPPTSAQ